jgi:hypothetical protein
MKVNNFEQVHTYEQDGHFFTSPCFIFLPDLARCAFFFFPFSGFCLQPDLLCPTTPQKEHVVTIQPCSFSSLLVLLLLPFSYHSS